MALEAEEPVSQGIVALFLQQGDRQELTLGLAHLTVGGVQVQHVHPVIAPVMPQISLRLGDLVGVVGEGVVDAAAVDVQVLAQVLHGDTGTLDMPAGIAHAPGRIPLEGLVFKLGLGEPEDEVVLVALVGVLLHALPDAHRQIIGVVVVEDIVALQLGGIEIDIAAGGIGVAGIHQFGDDLDILIDTICCGLHHVGPLDVELTAVLKEGVGVELGDLHDGLVLPMRALEHLVLAGIGIGGQVPHVGDVHDPLDVVAQVTQVLLQHILHDVGAQVADVGVVIDRRAAGVHLYDVRVVGNEFLFFVAGGVI